MVEFRTLLIESIVQINYPISFGDEKFKKITVAHSAINTDLNNEN